MKIIKFKECNVTFAENQLKYLPLSAHLANDGTVTSCWELSFFERFQVAFMGRIYLQVLTFNTPLQPLKMLFKQPTLKMESLKEPPGPPDCPRPKKYNPVG